MSLALPLARAPRPRLAWLGLDGRRGRTLALAALCGLGLAAVLAGAALVDPAGLHTDLASRELPPSLAHPFGTDPLGRDMLARTLRGLSLSLGVGLLAATASAVIALLLGLAASLSRTADAVVGWLVDATLGLPHLLLLIMICFALGGGTRSVILAVALTHWPRLARILRAEALQLVTADYVAASRRFGRSAWWVARHHLAPHLAPQFLVGLLLLFPHAILHEAGLTFLGFGIEPSRPAIGILLAESMRYLTAGLWWLGLFPGLALLATVLAFDGLAGGARALTSPRSSQD